MLTRFNVETPGGMPADVENAKDLFSCLSAEMTSTKKAVPIPDVSKVLSAGAPPGALAYWNRAFEPEAKKLPPFLRLAEEDGAAVVDFMLPQLRETFGLEQLVKACTDSKALQDKLNDPHAMSAFRLGGGRLACQICSRLSNWQFDELSLDAFETLCLLIEPDGQYVQDTRLRSISLPMELFKGKTDPTGKGADVAPLGDVQYLQFIHCIKKLPHLERVSVDGGRQWISLDQISGFGTKKGSDEMQIPGLLSMSDELKTGVTTRVVGDLATMHFSLTCLNLSYNELGTKGGEAIERLLSRAGGVQRVLLHVCQLGHRGLAAVFRGMRAPALPLINLATNYNPKAGAPPGSRTTPEANPEDCTALAEALAAVVATNKCPIFLELTANKLGSTLALTPHWELIAQSFASPASTLRQLNLSANEIGDAVGEALGLSLCQNKTLTNLNLNSNRLGDRSAKAFAVVVTSADSQLKVLSIVNNRIGPVGGDEFARVLEENYGEEASALYEATGMPPRTGLIARSGGELDLRSNPFASMMWTLLGLQDKCPCTVRLDASAQQEYSNAIGLARTMNAEQAIRSYGSPRPQTASVLPRDPSARALQRQAASQRAMERGAAPVFVKTQYSSPQEKMYVEARLTITMRTR